MGIDPLVPDYIGRIGDEKGERHSHHCSVDLSHHGRHEPESFGHEDPFLNA
jgi:hypothetical protein